MTNRPTWTDAGVFLGLIALAAGSRLIEAAPNVSAVGAAGLFAGFYFRRSALAWLVPGLSMLLSDALVGGHSLAMMALVYACLTLPVLFSRLLGERAAMLRVVAVSVLGALAFDLITNAAVWALGTMYTHDAAGLALCFERAIPFALSTLAGHVGYGVALFGAYRLAAAVSARRAAPAAA